MNTNDHNEQGASRAEADQMGSSADPERIVGDSKDWTWVLTETCPDCQFTATDIATRPQPEVWSPLEYACHVRDVYGVFTTRTHLLLNEQSPTFAEWDQDDAAVVGKYWEQEPGAVARNLAASAAAYASLLHEVPDDGWESRTAVKRF